MSLAEQIYQRALKLPEPAAQEVLDFINLLDAKNDALQIPPFNIVAKAERKPGSAKGIIWMADDFNDSIDDFDDQL